MRPLARLLGAALLLPAPALADPQPGALLATESADGSIVDVSGGGNVSMIPRFATGLSTPTGICVGPGGDILAAQGNGSVFLVTAGGDFSAAVPWATNLGNVIGMFCSDTEVVTTDNQLGRVFVATGGGDFSVAIPFAEGLPLVVQVLRAANGKLYAQLATGEIFDVTAGGDFSSKQPFAHGLPSGGGLAEHEGRLYASSYTDGSVYDVTGGGSFGGDDPFAHGLPTPTALLDVPGLGLFTASGNSGGINEISAGGDFTAVLPIAVGVETTFGLAGLAYVAGCGDGVEQAGETCDDGNTLANDGCDAVCQVESLCEATPANACILAGKGKLTIDERKQGKEKLALSLAKLAGTVGPAQLGNPVTGGTRYSICLYDGADAFRGELQVARGTEPCGKKSCWKRKGESGLAFANPAATDDGVTKISAKGGADGKGKIVWSAANKVAKGQTDLPLLAAGLVGASSATAQVVASDGACFELPIIDVKKAEAALFQGGTP
jgi:cysteine-rich repeat protein